MRRFGSVLLLKLNPKNFRSTGRATALLLVHLELESSREKARDVGHHPLPRPLAADVDIAVIRITHEAMLAPFEFSVEFIEHDVR